MLRSIKTVIWYGFLIWLVPFIIALFLYPVRGSQRPLFESIMSVVLASLVSYFAYRYFRADERTTLREGIVLGMIWLAMSLIIDLFLFMQGPMKMALGEYLKDIGLAYLIMPAVTTGFSAVLHERSLRSTEKDPRGTVTTSENTNRA